MTKSESPITPTYVQEDVQEILHIAITRKQDLGELSRVELLEIATELGISPSDLEAAELEWQLRKLESTEKEVFNGYRLNQLKQDITKFAIVNTFLVALNLILSQGIVFALSIMLIWGLFLTLKAWRTFQTQGEEYERAFQRWKLKKQVGKSIVTIAERVMRNLQSSI